jgi:hypothetical protein
LIAAVPEVVMARVSSSSNQYPDPTPPRRSRRRLAAAILALAASPFLVELVLLLVARWRGMSGQTGFVPTPALDSLGLAFGEVRYGVRRIFAALLHDPPWRVGPTVAIAAAWTVVMGLLLRGFRR